MRVLQLGPFPPPHGGVQSNLVAIHELLRRRGHSAEVVNITGNRRRAGDGVYYPRNAIEVLWLLLRRPADIIHLHLGGAVTPRLLALSLVCCSVPRRAAVLTFHSGGYPSSPEGRSARPRTLRGFVFRRFRRIIVVNTEMVDLFRRFGVNAEAIRHIAPHALPAGAPAAALPELLERFFAAHDPVLLTVGLLEPEYDLQLQIEVLGRVLERRSRAGLVIIGAGSLEPQLRARIDSAPYGEHVLLSGDVPHEATLRAIHECSVFLRSSRYDGDSVAVREALHLGAPVVASDTGMRPAGVRLFPVGDAALLERRIDEALAGPRPERRSAGGSEDNIEAVLAVYEELLRVKEKRT